MRIFAIVLVGLLIALQYAVWFSKNGELDLATTQRDIQIQEEVNEKLRQRNQEMYAEIDDLRQGLDAIEERARNELGLIKDDETFYRIIGDENRP
ncbi:cell division protein FtsB [Vibrio nigripulchritudo ATCC 27043]|uniref:Cell division protein FtsB n=2 Tax=Vibrio nigripulchritudo TaxID=28173 RepID=U4KC98_9VIBR|nr:MULTISPECIES: cell division protein FtsB [Vibrio]EGU60095.1 cell division protein FtsB [Vibrio nigripulchritudo ATCC 27043]KJY80748.1 cell division protein FtsB [Vibrio nigripulchritudo]UAB70746.1 cell division protein FtsB [Vibrio sp. SCSIO 43132]CCN33303.1 Cell division protein ftsB [Vibrio nigripulchritudo AM115]CCN42408.1 Cell division protein ftsB [Vibrio nigripulchritudo FTn2]